MRRVAGEHHGAARGLAAHHHQPGGVAVREAQADAGREVLVAGVEHDMVGVELADELRDGLAVERRAHLAVADLAAGGERHLGVLDVEPGVRESAQRAGMIVVQVGQDHVLDHRWSIPAARKPSRPGG